MGNFGVVTVKVQGQNYRIENENVIIVIYQPRLEISSPNLAFRQTLGYHKYIHTFVYCVLQSQHEL